MTTQARSLGAPLDGAAILRFLLALTLVALIVVGAAWLALTPASVSSATGVVAQKWVEANAQGRPAQYWIEVQDGRHMQRCAVAAYQSQLVAQWNVLQVGESASLTCYGQGAVNLTPP
ncbi:MAG: hypothetical protein KIS91_12485 [Anaerolineae bacterium]|nr:hypothetical protein [Anaerolineae bacterium]